MRSAIRSVLLAVAVLAAWVLAQNSVLEGQPNLGGPQWEYKVEATDFQEFALNNLGRNGWELVTISEHKPNTGYVAVFKRSRL